MDISGEKTFSEVLEWCCFFQGLILEGKPLDAAAVIQVLDQVPIIVHSLYQYL